MLKEIHPAEAEQLRGMASDMLDYFSENPNSLMVRCVGLYKLTWHSTVNGVASVRDEWMICMANLFSTDLCMHQKYDLKVGWAASIVGCLIESFGFQGSREGRCVAPDELAKGKEGGFTLRDYAFEEIEQVINIGPDMATSFLAQLQKDVQLLCNHNVMDYSLLVGVHHRKQPAKKCTPTEYQHTKTIFEIEKGGIPSACGEKVRSFHVNTCTNDLRTWCSCTSNSSQPSDLCVLQIYFIGLVDNLTAYTAKKYSQLKRDDEKCFDCVLSCREWETVFKSCLFDPSQISSVPP